jgi:hypothetical protein
LKTIAPCGWLFCSQVEQVLKSAHCEQSEPSAQGSLPVLVLVTVTEVWVVETFVDDVEPLPPPPVLLEEPPLPHAATATAERTRVTAPNAQVFMNYLQ